jgi:uncharacterized protein (UPF0128 family)
MKTFQIKDGNYQKIEDVIIEVIEDVVTNSMSETDIKNTIAFLENKKADEIADIEKEIAVNKELLAKIQEIDRTKAIS